jgi:hypothetical protein
MAAKNWAWQCAHKTDSLIIVREAVAGEFARVRVIGHTDYDLIAEPLQ